jgi:glutathione S-transferase
MALVLRFSPSSPYARKVRVAAHERGLTGRFREIASNPWAAPDDLKALNPLGKIPTLVTEDGLALYDSAVICEYLDTLGDAPRLFPPEGRARWLALRAQSLGDGVMDAAVLWRVEITQRKEQGPTPGWVERQQGAIVRALDALEREPPALAAPPDIGAIAIACALGYLDFRFGFLNWREGRPRLAEWHAAFAQRPSMIATRAKDSTG